MPEAGDLQNKQKREKWREFVHSLNPEIDPDTVRLMDRYFLVSHGLRRVGENSLSSSGLSFAKYRLLLELMHSQKMDGISELNPSEISRRQGTSRNTISSLVRDLENDGLVDRRLDPNDKRRFKIRLTKAGHETVSRYAADHLKVVASCFEGLASEEKDHLRVLLVKLSDQVTEIVNEPLRK